MQLYGALILFLTLSEGKCMWRVPVGRGWPGPRPFPPQGGKGLPPSFPIHHPDKGKHMWKVPVGRGWPGPRPFPPQVFLHHHPDKVHRLRCYTCEKAEPKSCTKDVVCDGKSNHCFSKNETGLITKGCLNSDACASPMSCCEGDLCNNAIPTGPSVILLLVSSAIITLFL